MPEIELYSCAERDAAQDPRGGLNSVERKKLLIELEKPYFLDAPSGGGIEVGYADACSMDSTDGGGIFAVLPTMLTPAQQQKVHVFGSSHRPKKTPEDDSLFQGLIRAGTPNVTIFVKSRRSDVVNTLCITPARNKEIIQSSIVALKQAGKRVVVDLEHFFDGYKEDAPYAIECYLAALEAGADAIVLCDTRGTFFGGSDDIGESNQINIGTVLDGVFSHKEIQTAHEGTTTFGVHFHDDAGMATANALLTYGHHLVQKHVKRLQFQGNLVTAGERVGNLNLTTFEGLLWRRGRGLWTPELYARLSHTCHQVHRTLTNSELDPKTPIVGAAVNQHGAGLHVLSHSRDGNAYDDPMRVRNGRQVRIGLSSYAGMQNIRHYLSRFGIVLTDAQQRKLYTMITHLPTVDYSNAWGTVAVRAYELLDGNEKSVPEVSEFGGTFHCMAGNGTNMEAWASTGGRSITSPRYIGRSDHGLLDNLSSSLIQDLANRGYEYLNEVKLIFFDSHNIDTGTDARVRSVVVFEDTLTGVRWETQSFQSTALAADLYAVFDALKYWILVKEGKITHYQDQTLLERFPESDEARLRKNLAEAQ